MKIHDRERATNFMGPAPRPSDTRTSATRNASEKTGQATGADKVAPRTWLSWYLSNGEKVYVRAVRLPRLTAKFMLRREALEAAERASRFDQDCKREKSFTQ